MSRTPQPEEFLVFPIVGLDLMVFFRGGDVSRPLYVPYSKFIALVSKSISPASALLLQTNGTDNGSQTLLNLIQGSGITITDDGLGGVTISASGGGSITADNGLTLTGSNVQLGGSLIQDTTIANSAFNLKLTGNPTTDPSFNSIFTIEATGSGSGRAMIKLIGSGTHGVYLDNSLSGIYGTTTSAAVTILGSGSGDVHNFTPATAFTQPIIKTFNRVFASGTAVNGDTVQIYVRLSDPAIGPGLTWYIDSLEWVDVTTGAVKYVKKISSLIKVVFNVHEINWLGQHTFNEYGAGNFTGTAAYYAAWDANGNFIEEPIPSGGGSVLSQNSVTGDGTLGSELELVNDAASPGNNKIYSTDSSGNKGWNPLGRVNSYFNFTVSASTASITVDIDTAGNYELASFSGAITSATYTINASPATLPFTLAIGDVFEATPDDIGILKLSGYVS